MTKEFADKVALVTGGASGIGKATVEAFAREGAHVVIADIDRAASEAVIRSVNGNGMKASYQQCDVREPASVEALIAHIKKTFGKLDCAVNNAGIDPEIHIDTKMDLATFDAIMATNVRGVFLCLQAEAEFMAQNGGGTIVNLASFAGVRGIGSKPAYVTSKHAVVGLTRATALHFVKQGVRINAVCPGPVKTPMYQRNLDVLPKDYSPKSGVPMERAAEPSELADVILWLSSPHSTYVAGQAISADGGMAV